MDDADSCDRVVWCAACAFPQTESSSRQAATVLLKFTTPKRAPRHGMFLSRRKSGRYLPQTYSVLVDEEASKTGDLYIRSVCFSPDGKYLATGAEDKQIRVCVLLAIFVCPFRFATTPCRHRVSFRLPFIFGRFACDLHTLTDLGHCQEAHPECVRRAPAGNLLPRLLA